MHGFLSALAYIWDQIQHFAKAIGLGGGVGIVAFLRYMKAPRMGSNWVLCALFDSISHIVSNGRSGERTAPDGTTVWIPPARRQPPKDEQPKEEEPKSSIIKAGSGS